MKLSLTTLALAAMSRSVSAGTNHASATFTKLFTPPIPFTQYDTNCDGDVLYTGSVASITKMEYGSFCISDNIVAEDGTTSVAYSKVVIAECAVDKIYENWSTCEDSACGECAAEYNAYTSWDSIDPESILDYCYDYTFSMDPIEKTSRNVAGTFESVMAVDFKFDDDADMDDVMTYLKTMDDNSCIVYGSPKVAANKESEDSTDIEGIIIIEEEEDSGSSALVTSAAFFMAGATSMLLA